MNIRQIIFLENQYIREEHPKLQIYLHHTAGNSSGELTFAGWANNFERIATCVAISGKGINSTDGEIIQGFSSKYWAYHLGLKESTFQKYNVPYKSLDKTSIGVEICNWGPLVAKDGKFVSYTGKHIPEEEICILDKPYKGFKYFHNYTGAQIASLKELLILWNKKYNIPLKYNEDVWDITARALKGEKGVFTHNSVRRDKVDIYPHPKMITMLKSLT
jgi:hypothetical protein